MRIAYLITRMDSLGGAQVHVRDMALAMWAAGHEVHVLTGSDGPFISLLRQSGIHCQILPGLGRSLLPWRDVTALLAILRTLRDIRPDLLSLHSSKAGWLGRVAGYWLRVPTIFTAHGWSFSGGLPACRLGFYRRLEQLASVWCGRIITVDQADSDLSLRLGIAPAEKLVTIHNGVKDVPSTLRAKPEINPPRLIMVARFQEPKDHASLLQALASLRHLDWSLELVGDGPLLEGAKTLAKRLGLQGRVAFSGGTLDVAERLAAAQIFVLLSHREGFPRSILEGMRAGLPVLASPVGGVAEAVEDGVTGLLCPLNGDLNELARIIEQLLADPMLRRQLGDEGRRRYERYFTFDVMLQKTMAEYERMLKKQKLQAQT